MKDTMVWFSSAAGSPLPLPGEHGIPETQTQTALPRCSPLPTSPSRLPDHLGGLQDKVPTCPPWSPASRVPWAPAPWILTDHPAASPMPKAACAASVQGGTFHQVPAAESCRESGTYMSSGLSSSLKTNLRTMPSEMPLEAVSQQQVLPTKAARGFVLSVPLDTRMTYTSRSAAGA